MKNKYRVDINGELKLNSLSKLLHKSRMCLEVQNNSISIVKRSLFGDMVLLDLKDVNLEQKKKVILNLLFQEISSSIDRLLAIEVKFCDILSYDYAYIINEYLPLLEELRDIIIKSIKKLK